MTDVLFHPTGKANILRGTTQDAYGDEVDSSMVVAEGVPAHFTESNRTVRTPSSDTPQVVRYYSVRLPGVTDLRVGDRVEDTSTGTLFTVDAFTRPTAVSPVADMRVSLRRVS